MSKRLVMMGVDGLDWRRVHAGIREGRLPNLAGLLENGSFAELAVRECVPGLSGAEDGMNSPALWTTIASGQYYFAHEVYDFCNPLHGVERPPLFESRHVRAPRVWDVLSSYDIPSLVVGYYVSHPAYRINGLMVSDLFGETADPTVVWPPHRLDEMAGHLGAANYDDYLLVNGLLGTEEGVRQTNAAAPVSAGLLEIVADIFARFTDLNREAISTLLQDADWPLRKLMEYRLIYPFVRDERFHRLFVTLLKDEQWRFATVYYRLIDFVSHGFWSEGTNLSSTFGNGYDNVVPRAYEWIDACVADVVARLDVDDCLILLSDHGFTAAPELPSLTGSPDISEFTFGHHADPAVLIVRGGAGRGRVPDVTLLDIAPSVLDYFAIPQAGTLDGGVVRGLLHADAPRNLPRVLRYAYSPPAAAGGMTEAEQQQVLQRLAALGYIDG